MADQVFWQSTGPVDEPEVGRLGGRPMCTNVHSQGLVDRTVDCQRASAPWKWPGRPGGRTLGHCPVGSRPAGRPTFPTVGNPTVVGRPGGRPSAVRTVELASNGQIFGAYKLGLPWHVFYKISREFLG